MNSKAWLLLNLALLGSAGVSVTNVVDLPKKIRKEQVALRKTIEKAPEESQEIPKSGTRSAKASTKKNPRTAEAEVADTWAPIRRGSLDAIWKKSLFSKNRTEQLASVSPLENGEKADELPAPPNFELVGILTIGSAKVAIIELKNNSSPRMNRMGGMGGPGPMMRGPRMTTMGVPGGVPMPPQQQQQAPQGNAADNFEPSFITAHENDELRNTGYVVVSINKEDNAVILEKSGLQYKLALDSNNSFAQQRIANQNTFLESQKQKALAAAKQQQQQQQQQRNQWQGRPGFQGDPGGWNRGGMQGGPGGWNRGGMQGGPGGMQGGPGGWNRGGMPGGTQGAPGSTNRGGTMPQGGWNRSMPSQNTRTNPFRVN